MNNSKKGSPTKRILVVEDENLIAMEIQDRLKSLGYNVPAITHSGEEAVELVSKIKPDLVLMDVMLDGFMDGIEAAKQIHIEHDIPIIFITAYSDDETLERAKLSEPYGYVLKPLEERELYTTIEIAFYKHSMEKRLKDNEQWLTTTLKSIGDAVITTDMQGSITFMNSVAESLTEWNLKDVEGQSSEKVFNIVIGNKKSLQDNPIKTVMNKDKSIEYSDGCILITKRKKEIPISYNAAPIRDDRGNLKGVVLVFRDMTERLGLEEQLRQSQKLEAIGQLAGGVAHDFNNIMTSIQLGIDLSLMDIKPGTPNADELKKNMKDIQHSASHAAKLAQQLLMFSRKHPMNPKLIDLNTLVKQSSSLLERLMGEDVQMKSVLTPDLWSTHADEGTIEQVIMNLIINAKDAMPSGGTLTLETDNCKVTESMCKNIKGAQPGKYICLTFKDTGAGIKEEIIEHIFEPFFSTKGPGKGTGLGLSVVYGIIKQHKGWIHVESAVNQGTTFKIYLPAQGNKPSTNNINKIKNSHTTDKGKKILVVEDEKQVREFFDKALTKVGYSVFAAEDSKQALEIFNREKGNIHLIFSDVVLPGINGVELVEKLRELKPELRILLCSGYTDDKSRWEEIEAKGYHFLDKSFTIKTLANKIQEVMDN